MNKTKRNTCKIEPIDKDYRLSFGNVQHIGKRDDQQDAFAISDNKDKVLSKEKGVFAIVADGMGGLDNGRESSNLVVTSMMRYFTEKPFLSSIPLELRNMVVSTNSDLLDHLSRTSNSKSGSTLVAIIIRDNELFWISVGDSRIYLYRKNRLYLLNRDHNYVNDLFQEVNDGKITLEDALSNPDRKALTSYMGISEMTVIDQNVKSFGLLPCDKLLLCSDGIYGSLNEEEMTEAMRLDTHFAALDLEERVLKKSFKGQDNMTAVVIGIN